MQQNRQAVINAIVPISTLLLAHHSFLGLKTSLSISILTVTDLVGFILDSLLSGNVLKRLTTRSSIYLCQLMEFILLIGFLKSDFVFVLVGAFGNALSAGVLSPRLQESLLSRIPENVMGAIQSSVSVMSMLLPAIISMLLVGAASGIGVPFVAVLMGMMILVAVFFTIRMKNLE